MSSEWPRIAPGSRPLATAVLGGTSVALAVSFSRVFEYWEYLTPLVSVAVLAHLIAFLMRQRPIPTSVSIMIQIAFVYVLNTWMHVRDTLWYGIPLGRTWSAISTRIGDSSELLGDVKPPLEFATGFGLVAGFSVGMTAILADAFAFRAAGRGEALVPSSVVFAVVSIVGEDRHRLLVTTVWLVTAIVAVAHLRRQDSPTDRTTAGQRTRASAATAATAVVVAMLAAWVGPRIPGAESEPLFGRDTDRGRIVEPLVDIRGQLGDRSDTVLFTVTADRPSYWKLTSLAEFDGSTWGIAEDELDTAGGRLGGSFDTSSTWTVTQTFTIENLRGTMAPAAYEASELRAASRSLYYALESGTLLVNGEELGPSDSYTIVSGVSDPATPLLEFLTSLSPPSSKYLDVPDNEEMNELGDLARDITAGSDSGYRAAIDLQNYFRTNFVYSLDVPALGGERAHLDFIARGSGYCEQFASTFAAMARSIGLPARVAIGFTPGADNGNGTFTVRSQHAHAWPEVWFDGLGWLLFEPTPGRGAPDRGYTGVEPQQDDSTPATGETTTTTSPTPVGPSTTVSASTGTPTTVLGAADGDSDTATSGSGPEGSTLLLFVIVLAVLAWPVVIRWIVSRVARRNTTPDVLVLWRRLLAEEGFTGDPDLTPAEIARRLNASAIDRRPDIDDAGIAGIDIVGRLATAVEKLLFAERPPSPEEFDELIDGVERRIAEHRPRRHRFARHLSPSVALRLAGLRGPG